MMKRVITLLILVSLAGCARLREVQFVYYNVSGNEIDVDIGGIPPDASPGILVPVHDDRDPLHRKGSIFFQPVQIAERIKVLWQESGKSHEVEFMRKDLGLPAELERGRIRFTYLGNEKWRVSLLPIRR